MKVNIAFSNNFETINTIDGRLLNVPVPGGDDFTITLECSRSEGQEVIRRLQGLPGVPEIERNPNEEFAARQTAQWSKANAGMAGALQFRDGVRGEPYTGTARVVNGVVVEAGMIDGIMYQVGAVMPGIRGATTGRWTGKKLRDGDMEKLREEALRYKTQKMPSWADIPDPFEDYDEDDSATPAEPEPEPVDREFPRRLDVA